MKNVEKKRKLNVFIITVFFQILKLGKTPTILFDFHTTVFPWNEEAAQQTSTVLFTTTKLKFQKQTQRGRNNLSEEMKAKQQQRKWNVEGAGRQDKNL